MQATGMMDICGRRFVLTGGASELTGLPEVARRMLARNVRNGRPMGIAGLPEMAKGAAFATVFAGRSAFTTSATAGSSPGTPS